MSAEATDPRLPQARAALERGDYGHVVRLLSSDTPPSDPEVLLLLATAYLGQGRNPEALVCCRRLRACGDPTLRAQARELQRVLEAPALSRPREWSLTLPDLGGSEAAMGRQLGPIRRRRRAVNAEGPPPPAVGPTRAPLGFAVVVTVLVLLGLLLGGCGVVRSELHFADAGRLQLRHHLLLASSQPAPWQRQLAQSLQQHGFQQQQLGRELVLSTPVLPSGEVLQRLAASVAAGAELAGLDLPEPQLELRSRNWLVGIHERFELSLDLRQLGPWQPDLSVQLSALPRRAVREASPLALQSQADASLVWPLQVGAANHMVVKVWRWSRLGLGSVGIGLLLLLSLTLQHLRRVLGFGLPALPR